MSKKYDLPAMPFYFGDWRKAPEIRALDLATRMIWFEMLGLMWESTERGYLTLNGKPVNSSVISKMVGCLPAEFENAIKQLEEFGVFSRRSDGAIFCRRMIRDEEMRQLKSSAGKVGMKKRYSSKKNFVITKHITSTESESISENDNENKNKDNKNVSEIFCQHFHLKLLHSEYKKLIADFIKTDVDAMIETVQGYSENYLKKYSSFNLIIRNWIKKQKHEPSKQHYRPSATAEEHLKSQL